MRATFISELVRLAADDERIWLLAGDLGYSVLEPFAAAYPERYLNTGVAEQNMIGVAAGLALSGKRVFVYSIANFPVMRCLEQLRNDVSYHQLPVTVVSVGAGFSYGSAGYSHHGLEDVAVMRSLPNMAVLVPADARETAAATEVCARSDGPSYLRLGKAAAEVHAGPIDLLPGVPLVVRPQGDIALVAMGGAVLTAVQAADILAAEGIGCRVVSVPSVSPLDEAALERAIDGCRVVLSLEEHGRVGGLYSALAEALAPTGRAIRGVWLESPEDSCSGSCSYLSGLCGLTAQSIVERVRREV